MSKTVKIGKKDVELAGRFQLKVRTDPKKFKLTNIDAFIPAGKTIDDKIKFMSKAGLINSMFIQKLITTFDPDKSEIDKHNVDVLIRHPNVQIDGMTDEDHQELVRIGLKNSNPKFLLTNIDKVADEAHDEEVKLIKLRSMIYDEARPISKEQFIWMASNFGISYHTQIQDEVRYKNHLQKEIDKHIQRNKADREKFLEYIQNWKLTEMMYYMNEFQLNGNITEMGGIYKVGPKPIGSSLNSVISYFENNPSEFQILKADIIEKYRNTVLS